MAATACAGFVGELSFASVVYQVGVVVTGQGLVEFIIVRGHISLIIGRYGVGDKTVIRQNRFLNIGQYTVGKVAVTGFEFGRVGILDGLVMTVE